MTIRITGDGPKITATGSGSTVLVEISTGQHDPGSFSGVHNDLTGRSTTGAHVGTAVSIDPSGFAGNLDGTITNAQLLAAAVDDLTTGGGGGGASLSDTTPQALGTAAAGTGTAAARDDHVHAMPTAADVGAAATGHDHSGVYQPADSDLTTIAGLTATTDSFIQAKSSAWAARTIAQVKTDLGLTPIPGITGWYADGVYSGLQGMMHSNIGGGGSAMTPGANLLWLWRIMPVETIDVDGAYFVISTSGTSGAVARVGIYAASSSTTEPTGAPLCDTTGLAVTDAGGSDVVGSFTAVRLTAWTPYWGFMLTNNATFAPRFLANAANTVQSNRLDTGQVTGSSHTMRRVAATYGTPPTNPSAPFTTANSAGPGVLWKTRRV